MLHCSDYLIVASHCSDCLIVASLFCACVYWVQLARTAYIKSTLLRLLIFGLTFL